MLDDGCLLIAILHFYFCDGVINKLSPIVNQSFTRFISCRVKAEFPEGAHLREDTGGSVSRLVGCDLAQLLGAHCSLRAADGAA